MRELSSIDRFVGCDRSSITKEEKKVKHRQEKSEQTKFETNKRCILNKWVSPKNSRLIFVFFDKNKMCTQPWLNN